MTKQTVLVLCGGRSDEHEISLISAFEMLKALDRDRFEPILVGVAKSGSWHLCPPDDFAVGAIRADEIRLNEAHPVVSLDTAHTGRGSLSADGQRVAFDVAFPLLHGPLGEDGTVQGLFEMLGVPYVGAGVAASANCMDKELTKTLAERAGIQVAPWVAVRDSDRPEEHHAIVSDLGLPLFVKPCRAGSSVGVSKVSHAHELVAAVAHALQFDTKCLVEQAIPGREIECAALGLFDDCQTSLPGEIIVSDEAGFYSYDAKYILADGARTVAPAELSDEQRDRVQALVTAVFRALEIDGMARVDVFLDGNQVYLNEANTIPGFTPISMYPKMWEASGLSYGDLLTRLIELAFQRAARSPFFGRR